MITAIEGVAHNLIELAPLLKRQWDELGEYKDRMPLVPDFGLYIVREAQGQCFMATVRDDRRLVGYYIAMVQPLPHHTTTLAGYIDFMWVEPDVRGLGAGQMLLNMTEMELRRRGVKIWLSASRVTGSSHKHMDRLLADNGFKPLDLMYAKWIGA